MREREREWARGTVPGSSKCAFSHLTVLLRRWSFLYNVWELHYLAGICLWVSSSFQLFSPQTLWTSNIYSSQVYHVVSFFLPMLIESSFLSLLTLNNSLKITYGVISHISLGFIAFLMLPESSVSIPSKHCCSILWLITPVDWLWLAHLLIFSACDNFWH